MRIGNVRTAAVMAVLFSACTGGQDLVGSKFLTKTFIPANAGGTLTVTAAESQTLAGLTVTVPAGSLITDATLTVAYGMNSPAGSKPAGVSADLGPSGTQFRLPATVTVPFALPAGAQANQLVIYAREGDGHTYQIGNSELTVSGGFVSFTVNGFTEFQPGTAEVIPPLPDGGDGDDGGVSGDDGGTGDDGGVGDDGGTDSDGGPSDCASQGLATCTAPDGGSLCTNTNIDAVNCGQCGMTCSSGICSGGACAACESNGLSTCGLDDGGSTCIDTSSDGLNCGQCGHACLSGSCASGACTCAPGTYVDVFSNPSYSLKLSQPADPANIKVYLDGPPPDQAGSVPPGVLISQTNPGGSANWTFDSLSDTVIVNSDNVSLGGTDVVYIEYTVSSCTLCAYEGRGCDHDSDCCNGTCGVSDAGDVVCMPSAGCVADFAGCTTSQDCCSGACENILGVAGMGNCVPVCASAKPAGESCTDQSQCCTGQCTAYGFGDAGTTPGVCELDCHLVPQYCSSDSECCSHWCSLGLVNSTNTCIPSLDDAGARCLWDGVSCTQDSECCGGYCSFQDPITGGDAGAGQCTEFQYNSNDAGPYPPCLPENAAWDFSDVQFCCSQAALGLADGGYRCFGQACLPQNALCYGDVDCCTGYCLGWDAGFGGTCLPREFAGCLGGNADCAQDGDCCSGSCLTFDAGVEPDSGVYTTVQECDATGICSPIGNVCYENLDCCSGYCGADDAGRTCQTPSGG